MWQGLNRKSSESEHGQSCSQGTAEAGACRTGAQSTATVQEGLPVWVPDCVSAGEEQEKRDKGCPGQRLPGTRLQRASVICNEFRRN